MLEGEDGLGHVEARGVLQEDALPLQVELARRLESVDEVDDEGVLRLLLATSSMSSLSSSSNGVLPCQKRRNLSLHVLTAVKLGQSSLLRGVDLLAAGELELGPRERLDDGILVLVVGAHRHQRLPDPVGSLILCSFTFTFLNF